MGNNLVSYYETKFSPPTDRFENILPASYPIKRTSQTIRLGMKK
jgi:hypothetical protein